MIDERVRRPAGRASLWGPVPEDPEIRAAALGLAEHALAESQRRPVFAVVVPALLLANAVWLAVLHSPWFWLAAVFFAALLAMSVLLPGRLRRRIELLRSRM